MCAFIIICLFFFCLCFLVYFFCFLSLLESLTRCVPDTGMNCRFFFGERGLDRWEQRAIGKALLASQLSQPPRKDGLLCSAFRLRLHAIQLPGTNHTLRGCRLEPSTTNALRQSSSTRPTVRTFPGIPPHQQDMWMWVSISVEVRNLLARLPGDDNCMGGLGRGKCSGGQSGQPRPTNTKGDPGRATAVKKKNSSAGK